MKTEAKKINEDDTDTILIIGYFNDKDFKNKVLDAYSCSKDSIDTFIKLGVFFLEINKDKTVDLPNNILKINDVTLLDDSIVVEVKGSELLYDTINNGILNLYLNFIGSGLFVFELNSIGEGYIS